jgi:serine/threonine-protein kinase
VGIVHRDVKPSNLLLHPDGRLLLADFGVARALHGSPDASLTTAGMTMGTPEYMAPEQIRGEKVGPAADIYALGVVAYALLAAHTPFEIPALAHAGAAGIKDAGATQAETRAILERQLNDPPPPLRAQNGGVAPRLEEAIFWALAKAPTDRPPTAGAFVRAAREGSRSRSLSAFFSKTGGKAEVLLAGAFATTAFAPSLPRSVTPASAPVTPARGIQNVETFQNSQALMQSGDPDETPFGPDTPTVHDLPLLAGRPAPQWPSPTPNPQPKRPFSLMKLLVITASVLLACAFLASGASVVGYLLQNYSAASSSRSPAASATTQPTTTPDPTATVDASEILAVSSTSVSLPCRTGKRLPTVSLSNTGQDTAQWAASLSGPQIFVNPSSGTLDPGERQTITLYGLSFTTQDRQGTLRFTVAVGDQESAVAGPTISYTLQGCSRASIGDTQSLTAQSDGNTSSQHKRKRKQD